MPWVKRFFFTINSLAWAPDGTRLAVGLARGVRVVDSVGGASLFGVPAAEIRSVAWSEDGSLLAGGGQDGRIHLWNVVTEQVATIGRFHQHPVISLQWSPQGALLLSGSSDLVHIWDTQHQSTCWQSTETTGYPVQVAWAPDGQRFAFADHQYAIQIHATATGTLLATYRGHAELLQAYQGAVVNPVSALAWSPQGQQMASQGLDGVIHIWDAATLTTQLRIRDAYGWAYLLAWAPQGNWLAGCRTRTEVGVWDSTTGQLARTYQGHQKPLAALVWAPDASRIASASGDRLLHVW
jgi:WD40 repeat protein